MSEERLELIEKHLVKLAAQCFEMEKQIHAINKKFSDRDNELAEQLEMLDKKFFYVTKNVVEYVKNRK